MHYVAHFEEKSSRKKTLLAFAKNTPKIIFPNGAFQGRIFFTNLPYHLFLGPNGICGAFRGKIFSHKNFNRFYLKRSRNRFSEKYVFSPNYFMKLPHLFLGPNELCGAFRGKIVTEENFTRFCIKHHEQSFRSEQFSLETRDTVHLGQKISEGAIS